eukprot:235309_1
MNKAILAIIHCILLLRNGDCYVSIPPSNVFFRLADKSYNKWVTQYPINDIIAYNAAPYSDQLWRVIDNDGQYFRFENKARGGYLTASANGDVFPYNTAKYDDQLWQIYQPDADGIHFRLRNKARGTVLVIQKNDNNYKVFAHPSCCHDQFFRFEYDVNWQTCQYISYQFVNENKFPLQAEVYTAEYSNTGPIEQSLEGTTFQMKKCISRTVETSQSTNWEVGMEASVGFSILGAAASVTTSFSVGGEFSKTKSRTEEECNAVSITPPICPAGYTCKRIFTVSVIPETTKDVKVRLNCQTASNSGSVEIDWYGTLKVSGGARVTYADTFNPLACFEYYSRIYNDRNNKLPFCKDCSSSDICNQCEYPSSAAVLIHIDNGNNPKVECITNLACDVYCGGEIKGDEFAGFYCDNPDISKTDCQWHLTNTGILS